MNDLKEGFIYPIMKTDNSQFQNYKNGLKRFGNGIVKWTALTSGNFENDLAEGG